MNLNSVVSAVKDFFCTKFSKCISWRNILLAVFGTALVFGLSGCKLLHTGVLNPKGIVAHQERQLLFDAVALMLIVVIPVIIMSFAFAFRYRASHKTSEYKPTWSHSVLIECDCWGVPCVIIVILGIMTWKKTHSLDPYHPVANVPGKPLLIEAVALPWKWLFIYPEQKVATVNYVEMPRGRQVEFYISSDNVPMSAFFIPQLGSQIYSMAGMRTRLHLVATEDGTYKGLDTQYNGAGFSEMHFKTNVVESADFDKWVTHVQQANSKLSFTEYRKLLKPSIAAPVMYFSAVEPNLFNRIMMQYMKPNMRLDAGVNYKF